LGSFAPLLFLLLVVVHQLFVEIVALLIEARCLLGSRQVIGDQAVDSLKLDFIFVSNLLILEGDDLLVRQFDRHAHESTGQGISAVKAEGDEQGLIASSAGPGSQGHAEHPVEQVVVELLDVDLQFGTREAESRAVSRTVLAQVVLEEGRVVGRLALCD
jgi:hypothetical protein